MNSEPGGPVVVTDDGLGLLEIVISMFIISLLAIAFIPVMVPGLRATEATSTIATASRLVAQAIETARATGAASCAEAQLLADAITEVDAQGVTIEVTTTVTPLADCTEGSATTVTATARDAADAGGTPLAQARTLLFLAVATP